MQSVNHRAQVNKMLGKLQLGQLEDPGGLVPQLAYMVTDHDHLRALIATCPPEDRVSMYESLKPYLRFEAHPLDWYVAEAAAVAEACKLPIWDGTGVLKEQKTAEIRTIERVVEETLLAGRLHLTCRKCTFTETFCASTDRKIDAIEQARSVGWFYDPVYKYEVCPTCAEDYALD